MFCFSQSLKSVGVDHLGGIPGPARMGARSDLMASLNPMFGVGVGHRPYGGPQAVALGAGMTHLPEWFGLLFSVLDTVECVVLCSAGQFICPVFCLGCIPPPPVWGRECYLLS